MFGLQNFADKLQAAIAGNSSPDDLPGTIYTQLTTWLVSSIRPILITAAVVATLFFTFYGAFLYFTAYGDENKATQAKKSITYAIVGFIITLLAFSISAYVQNIILTKPEAELSAPGKKSDDNSSNQNKGKAEIIVN